MKKLLASIAVLSAMVSPALAQGVDDTASNAPASEISRDLNIDSIAAMPAGIDMNVDIPAVGAASVSPLANTFSDEQLEKIAKLKGEFSDTAATKAAQLHSLGRELRSQLSQANIDKKQVMDIQSKINNLKDEIANAKLNMRLDTIALLTPEQRQKFHHAALQRQVLGARKGPGSHHHHGHRHGSADPATPAGAASVPPA